MRPKIIEKFGVSDKKVKWLVISASLTLEGIWTWNSNKSRLKDNSNSERLAHSSRISEEKISKLILIIRGYSIISINSLTTQVYIINLYWRQNCCIWIKLHHWQIIWNFEICLKIWISHRNLRKKLISTVVLWHGFKHRSQGIVIWHQS